MLDWMLDRLFFRLFLRVLLRMFLRMLGRMPIVDRTDLTYLLAVRSSDRAVFMWGLGLVAVSSLALFEFDYASSIAAAIILVLFPGWLSALQRSLLLAIAVGTLFTGPHFLIVAVPFALTAARHYGAAARSILVLACCGLLAHHAESIPNVAGQNLHLGSMGFVAVPSLAAAAVFGLSIGWRLVATILLGAVALLVALDAGASRWVTYEYFGSPLFRIIASLVPICAATLIPHASRKNEDRSATGWLVGATLAGIAATAFFPTAPIKLVMFDESHGRWETISATFGPTDFGRGANYNYALLAGYAERLVGQASAFNEEGDRLPGHDSVFVLKMPALPLSNAFGDRLEQWVREGGRLLVIADHTDLYDHAQNLNVFLNRFGVRLNSDAVFDPAGLPTAPRTDWPAAAFGRIDAFGQPLPWQTGTSLAAMPGNAVPLAAFGLSFSEPGDYSRDNRFGTLLPRSSLRLTNHTAIVAATAGNGALAVVLDSTPWSTFSIFKEQYTHLFRGVIHALSRVAALQVWGWGGLALALITLLAASIRHRLVLAIGGLALGLTFGAAAQIGAVSLAPSIEGRDFKLKVVVGEKSKLEFLEQLVGPGEQNFSRIVSAMAKYGLIPSAGSPGIADVRLGNAKNWLYVQPDARQLPSYEGVIRHLERGGGVTFLFSPAQAADPAVLLWLGNFGLYAQKRTALAVMEDARGGGILNRRGPAILRDIRVATAARPTSLLKDRESDQFFQSYTLRAVAFPRKSGVLTLGFSADQFSDSAIGDVWEGIHPASIGRLRERQLAAVLNAEDFVAPFPDRLSLSSSHTNSQTLDTYLLLEDGRNILFGKFGSNRLDESSIKITAPIENPVGYLEDLRDRANFFVASSCPRKGRVTQCEKRMLGSDVVEWMVTWASNDDGQITAIELLHERRFSGLGNTLNVVFGN